MHCALLLVATQLVAQTEYPSVARNKTGTTDFAWVSLTGNSYIYFKRDETPCCASTPTTITTSGFNVENDIDDDTSITGQFNSVVVWQVTNNGANEIWMSVNAGTPIRVGQKADNSYEQGGMPRVAIARTGGKFVVTFSQPGIKGQLYQIGSGSSVTRLSYPFDVSVPGPNGGFLNGGVSCADNGDFVATWVRFPGSGPSVSGVVIRGFVMPSSFGNPSVKFGEYQVHSGYTYTGTDVASYADGTFVVAWGSASPSAQRFTVSGGNASPIANTRVDITGGCSYPHPCGSTDAVNSISEDPYDISVAAQRCSPGNYVVVWNHYREADGWETIRLKICEDQVRTHCSEDVLPMAAADSYPEPDIFRYPRVGMDDCGRMVSSFRGTPWGGSLAIYTYLESLCESCETECIEELEPCLAIPVPDCGDDLARRVALKGRKASATKALTLALAPVPIEPVGTKALPAREKQSLERPRAAKLEPKPVSSLTKASKPSKKAPTRTLALKP